MDSEKFVQYAKENSVLRLFLSQVAAAAARERPKESSSRYVTVTGTDILAIIAAHAMYRWLRDYFDHRRGLREAEIAKQQAAVIKGLIRDGFPPESAHAVTVDLLKKIAERTIDESSLTTWAGLIKKD